MAATCRVIERKQQEDGDLIKPKKLPNPFLESHQHRALHRELHFCCRRGVLPRERPELQRVLEKRQREQQKQRADLSDLEMKLRTRQQRMQACELEQQKSENLENVPEFVRVRGTLRHIQIYSQTRTKGNTSERLVRRGAQTDGSDVIVSQQEDPLSTPVLSSIYQ